MTSAEREAFFRFLEARFQATPKDALSPARQKAWEKFIALGLPDKADEAFRFVSLRDLYSEMSASGIEATVCVSKDSIAQAILPECSHSHLIFVDGVYVPELSDTTDLSLVLLSFPLAMRSHGHFLQSHLLKAVKEEKDPFAVLNLALHASGVFLYVPPGQSVSRPVQCIYVTTGKTMRFSASRLQIVLGAQSKLEWVATHLPFSGNNIHCSVPAMDLLCEEGAHCVFASDLTAVGKQWCFDSLRAHLKRDAYFKAVNILGGGTRQSIYVRCAEENSEVDLKGLCMLRGSSRAHAHTIVDHSAPCTRSLQLFKGIVHDASQSSFDGKILVRQAAQKTEAYQLNNNLILGKAAIAHSTPTLEIFADDVKASHGATVARPCETQLFYLKSRGISEREAQELLLSGFYREVLDEIPYAHMRSCLLQRHLKPCEVAHG